MSGGDMDKLQVGKHLTVQEEDGGVTIDCDAGDYQQGWAKLNHQEASALMLWLNQWYVERITDHVAR